MKITWLPRFSIKDAVVLVVLALLAALVATTMDRQSGVVHTSGVSPLVAVTFVAYALFYTAGRFLFCLLIAVVRSARERGK